MIEEFPLELTMLSFTYVLYTINVQMQLADAVR